LCIATLCWSVSTTEQTKRTEDCGHYDGSAVGMAWTMGQTQPTLHIESAKLPRFLVSCVTCDINLDLKTGQVHIMPQQEMT